jgi:hypothetical protein
MAVITTARVVAAIAAAIIPMFALETVTAAIAADQSIAAGRRLPALTLIPGGRED